MSFVSSMGGLNGDPEYPDGEYDQGEDGSYYTRQYSAFKKSFTLDKWYYHKKVKVEIIHETEKALLLKDKRGKYWIPKKLIHLRTHKRARQWIGFTPEYIT